MPTTIIPSGKPGPRKTDGKPAKPVKKSGTGRAAILASASAALAGLRQTIAGHEASFMAATLAPRLKIGLHCLKAHQAFAMKNPGKRGQGRKNNHVTHDVIATPEGFEGWLVSGHPWLKKATAYKYMTAVRGLGLDHQADEAALDAALAARLGLGAVTLRELCDSSLDRIGETPPEEPQQTEFEFIRHNLSAFREEAQNILAIADRLRQIPDAHRAACARAYTLLRELTGSDWSPSDTPDPLATVDPDHITI